MTTSRIATLLLCTSLFPVSHAMAVTIYSNTFTDTGNAIDYSVNGYTQIGDEVTFAGTARTATSATARFVNLGTAGTFDATLRLFYAGLLASSPVGAQIGSDIVMTALSVGSSGQVDVTFSIPSVIVPDTLVFTLSVANVSAGPDLALPEFNLPTIGSSDPSFFIFNDGTAFSEGSTGSSADNIYFQLQATTLTVAPEPTAFVLALPIFALLLNNRASFARRARLNG